MTRHMKIPSRHVASPVLERSRQSGAGCSKDGVAKGGPVAHKRCVRNATVTMLVAAVVLLVFNSTGLKSWLRDLPGNRATDVLVERADQWHALMQRVGFTRPKVVVQDALSTFREADWIDLFGVGDVEARESVNLDAEPPPNHDARRNRH
jgi:hypothetical protein